MADNFKRETMNSRIKFLMELYGDEQLTLAQIQNIIESHIDLLNDKFINVLKQKIFKLLDRFVDSRSVAETVIVKTMFCDYQSIYSYLDTHHKRTKIFRDSGAYIEPQSYVIGDGVKDKKINNKLCTLPIETVGQFIPPRAVLKSFLEMPDVFKIIKAYQEKLESEDDGIIVNVVQGTVWKENIKPLFTVKTNQTTSRPTDHEMTSVPEENNVAKVVFPLTVYFDEFETAELGSHMVVHKIGAVYYTISCLPPQFQSNLDYIYTALLFYSDERKRTSNYDVFRPLLNELKQLEEKGITVVSETGVPVQVFFAVTLIVGDNAGVHAILGFVESFSATYCCRVCKTSNEDTGTQLAEDVTTLRNGQNYEKDVQENNVSVTGIKEECIWHTFPSFHVTENIAFDIMHDLDEGILNLDMCGIISTLISRRRFDYELLNDRIQGFDYNTCEVRNKPPLIKPQHIKNKKLHTSASECLCLVRYFGLMVADLVHVDDEDKDVWDFYNVIRKIVDMVMAPTVIIELEPIWSRHIFNHHKMFLELFPEWQLTAKAHHMLHMWRAMRATEPASAVSTYKFERLHCQYKPIARHSKNRVNLPMTLAKKHQWKLCSLLVKNEGFKAVMRTGEVRTVAINSIDGYHNCENRLFCDNFGVIPTTNYVEIFGTRYDLSMVLLLRLGDEYPVFGKIMTILPNIESQTSSFLLKVFNTVQFSDRYYAYEVESTDTWAYNDHTSLLSHLPTHVRTSSYGDQYVTFRHFL